MDQILNFLESYFFYIWLVLVIATVLILFIRGRKALNNFGEVDYSKSRFYEKHASGFSLKPKKWNRGRASGTLHILITDKEFILKSFMFGAGTSKRMGLLQRIPLENILSTELKSGFLDTKLHVKCETVEGEEKEFVLISKGHARIKELLDEAIQQHQKFK